QAPAALASPPRRAVGSLRDGRRWPHPADPASPGRFQDLRPPLGRWAQAAAPLVSLGSPPQIDRRSGRRWPGSCKRTLELDRSPPIATSARLPARNVLPASRSVPNDVKHQDDWDVAKEPADRAAQPARVCRPSGANGPREVHFPTQEATYIAMVEEGPVSFPAAGFSFAAPSRRAP